ncbi:type II toxin-antitoxin system PemK/MazF family toxin [candidate division KSB1 bacterium]|nr:type II toxin-antitoxin system PemK/MazF family toxin [candidate division KSB1 bacterium]NIR72069.1 type II toxin-antitoxin system PemK/MazF family toxin [candidate division KSB1 bacterium]NIS26580.1 type II toxin-antitoxin system PemK/MazF family toxin [candidate division KSB1 bacterium]NIT73342.1 type II toxin-antitoxin system PemK/MazF family toxin [candidate division KSB1 bacterium]NIU27190.1 type II toxin-antitoxin system PemK/MazF family toxin [candidate division KSB1 bacterium]
MRRGGIYVASLDPIIGREISKTRPVLVISNDINNRFSGTVTVLPITSKKLAKVHPFEVFLPKGSGNLPKDSKVKADQIRTLDRSRFVSHLGLLQARKMIEVERAVKIHLELS